MTKDEAIAILIYLRGFRRDEGKWFDDDDRKALALAITALRDQPDAGEIELLRAKARVMDADRGCARWLMAGYTPENQVSHQRALAESMHARTALHALEAARRGK